MAELNNTEENSDKNERQSSSWDLSNAFGNYSALVITQFGAAFFSFASVWLITRYLGAEGYGGIFAIIAASQVAQILVHWTSYAVVRFGTEEFIESAKLARIFWLRLLILLPNMLLVLLASRLWFPPLAEWLKLPADSFLLVVLHFMATTVWIHVQFTLQGAKLPRVQGFLVMLERVLSFAGIAILIGFGNLSSFSALISYSVSPFLMVIAGIFFLRQFIFARFSVDRQFIKKVLVYSLPLLPSALVGYFSGSYVDAIFISKFLSTKDLGIYSVAAQINGIVLQLPTLANSLLLPLFVSLQKESDSERTQNYFRNILPSLTLFWGVICAFLAFAGYLFLPIIFGVEFNEATLSLWILLTATAISLPALCGYSAFANSVSKTHIALYAAIFSSIANIVANFWLIPKYGLAGCAWASVIAYFVNVFTFAIFLYREMRLSFSGSIAAFVPIVLNGLVFYFTRNALLSVLVCLSMSFLVAYCFSNSLRQTLAFLKKFRMI